MFKLKLEQRLKSPVGASCLAHILVSGVGLLE